MSGDLRIVGVALLLPNRLVISLPAPSRHHHIISMLNEAHVDQDYIHRAEQGFLVSSGKFATRRQAYRIAFEAHQLLPKPVGGPGFVLFSENVW
jgi:hypothetical protein